jgi:hypothetical protein
MIRETMLGTDANLPFRRDGTNLLQCLIDSLFTFIIPILLCGAGEAFCDVQNRINGMLPFFLKTLKDGIITRDVGTLTTHSLEQLSPQTFKAT